MELNEEEKAYVLAEVAHLIALPALHALRGTRPRTLLSIVTLLLAILRDMRVYPLFGTVASSVAFFGAVNALYGGRYRDRLGLLLLAVLGHVGNVTDYIQAERDDHLPS